MKTNSWNQSVPAKPGKKKKEEEKRKRGTNNASYNKKPKK